eukprot:CAMPEP_0183300078 /NCGR_PEP_ID=MMETSP0160_2-20130417/6621_1 /TAXON_ID=2839 ORGANISM="Odontella Sinensis, Strain Grunow 1884" /NCGR_SAMPLE_ID=MMETSP0160_2 /ASSEMBLY_ACC=CAM_ASM_000250 /LENGTH=99 /DNA_ID=CAMNT_0025462437 /DNA_START=152 /DNA_END=447 /DNA_ORIENTATION=+
MKGDRVWSISPRVGHRNNAFRKACWKLKQLCGPHSFLVSKIIFFIPSPSITDHGNFRLELCMCSGFPNETPPATLGGNVPDSPSSPKYFVTMFAPREFP